ncbi:GNAT family N-acetyltransferase [Streptomyces albus subsp. chlorinus]|uniref:GNAT family N-acetyltransferase n=1 Tax=Streptomyces albus TaxID=1888 RepID=UPI00156FA80B|nr:GNAT family N-acetyltransferase [Streptomyces albus]NSC20327.1 GNAT family N-acetyltransferase [Streptomyces albus subsp. chlorinus]
MSNSSNSSHTSDTAQRGAAPLTFRRAVEADIPALTALVESAYRGEASRAGWTTEADLLDGQRTDPEGVGAVVRDPDSILLVAERAGGAVGGGGADGGAGAGGSGRIIACCQLERRGVEAYFGMFAVNPLLQGGGVGRTVLAEAERTARAEWGTKQMQLKVIRQREDLIAWYERRGYTRTGELSPFPYGDERFGRPQRADLVFELLVKPLE